MYKEAVSSIMILIVGKNKICAHLIVDVWGY